MDNKKKKFNTNRVAAYALSGVMLASVIPYNVFANAEVFNDNIQSESVLEKSQENPNIALRDAAPPEDTSTSSDAKNAVHGYVGVLVGGDINADLAAETGQRFKPIGFTFNGMKKQEIGHPQPTMQLQELTDSSISK